MYKNNKILALIPARGGSKGIKNKNIIDIMGKPLIYYTIQAAKESVYIDDIVVTTDDEVIANISIECGAKVPFLRPKQLAQDTSKTIDAVLHAILTLEQMGPKYDTLILLQPTQPLRTSEDIDKSIECFFCNGELSLVSVSEVDDHPLLIREIVDNKLLPLLLENSTCRRQDMKKYYRINGCIYINKVEEINSNTSFNDNLIPFIMKKSHSVDIDEVKDLVLTKYYLKIL